MFTIKYRTHTPAAKQPADGPPNYDTCEQISGPWSHISQEMEDGYIVVHAHDEHGNCGCTFGPVKPPEADKPQDASYPTDQRFRPTLYVMNEGGATVAKYDL